MLQEKINEYLGKIYSFEIEVERLKLNLDKSLSEREGMAKQRDYYKIDNDKLTLENQTLLSRINELDKNYEDTKAKLGAKEKEILTLAALEKTYQERFEEFTKKVESLKKQLDDLDQENMTNILNLKTYKEENERMIEEKALLTKNMSKLNEERNYVTEQIEAANRKIASFVEQINHCEDIIARQKKEINKIKTSLVNAERYSDMIEIKKDAFERTTEIQKRQLLEQIKTISEQATSEKDSREKWIERYEAEYKSHLKTTTEVMQLRTDVKALAHKCKNYEIELNLIKKEHSRTNTNYEDKKLSYVETLKELEQTKREWEATKGMLSMVELQHTEYVTRLRAENKKLIAKHELEIRIMEMSYEDIRSTCGNLFLHN